jgi:hypothetical protein
MLRLTGKQIEKQAGLRLDARTPNRAVGFARLS